MAGLVVGVGDGGYSSDPDKCDHKQIFDRDARRSGPTIPFVNLFPLLLV